MADVNNEDVERLGVSVSLRSDGLIGIEVFYDDYADENTFCFAIELKKAEKFLSDLASIVAASSAAQQKKE